MVVGFWVIYLFGVGVVNVFFGLFDLGMIFLVDVFSDIWRICEVIELLFFVDVDMGWGIVLGIVRIICELVWVGVLGMYLED